MINFQIFFLWSRHVWRLVPTTKLDFFISKSKEKCKKYGFPSKLQSLSGVSHTISSNTTYGEDIMGY
jgi:hypothetical protein